MAGSQIPGDDSYDGHHHHSLMKALSSISLKSPNQSPLPLPAMESFSGSSSFSSPRRILGMLEISPTFSKSCHEPRMKRSSGGLEQKMHGEASDLRSRNRKRG